MARFKYLGEPPRSFVVSYGPCTKIRVFNKDGSTPVLTPVPPATQFAVGQDIGYDITDERAVRYLSNDPRFERIS
jgi:hypothetical protein